MRNAVNQIYKVSILLSFEYTEKWICLEEKRKIPGVLVSW
jgi:hypothetical protein